MPLTHSSCWREQLGQRMRRLWLLKAVGITAFTWLFFVAYFHLLRHPAYVPEVMPLTALDQWLPFQPQWLPVYLSLWFYVGIAPGLQPDFRQLLAYGLWVGGLCIAGLAIFYRWPTQVPALLTAPSDAPGFEVLRGVDAAGNACPSMHVAVALFTAVRVHAVLRQVGAPRWLAVTSWLWCAAIAYSTLAVKQHVLLDTLAGAALGLAFAWASLHWRPVSGAPASPAAPRAADIIAGSHVPRAGATTDTAR